MDTHENVIEFYTDEKSALCTFTQKKWINKCKKLAEQFPDEVEIRAENKDGSIVVKIPLRYLHITRYNRTGNNNFGNDKSDLEVEEEDEQS